MTNKIVRKIGDKKIGFFLGSMSQAEYQEESGYSLQEFLKDKEGNFVLRENDKGEKERVPTVSFLNPCNNCEKLYAIFLKSCANAYRIIVEDKDASYSIRDGYMWIDEMGTDGITEFTTDLLLTPKAEAEEGK